MAVALDRQRHPNTNNLNNDRTRRNSPTRQPHEAAAGQYSSGTSVSNGISCAKSIGGITGTGQRTDLSVSSNQQKPDCCLARILVANGVHCPNGFGSPPDPAFPTAKHSAAFALVLCCPVGWLTFGTQPCACAVHHRSCAKHRKPPLAAVAKRTCPSTGPCSQYARSWQRRSFLAQPTQLRSLGRLYLDRLYLGNLCLPVTGSVGLVRHFRLRNPTGLPSSNSLR